MTTYIALAAILVSPAQQNVQAQLDIRYRLWDSAYLKHDVISQAKLLHPSFRIVTGSRKVISRSRYVQSLWKGAAPEVYQTTVVRAERHGLTAYAWTRERSKQKAESEHLHRYKDTWRLVRGHWLLTESKTLGEE